jgi:hypothetical protein
VDRLLNIKLQDDDRHKLEEDDELLLNFIMKQWLPVDDVLLTMIAIHSPSPIVVEKNIMLNFFITAY